jgi:PAS domain S-box-containing protein
MNENVSNGTLRILVVEDEEAHAELICRAFDEGSGKRYVVNVAHTLQEARDYLEKSKADLVITDLLLPDGKGTDLFSDHEHNGHAPLIVMTSHGTEQVAVEALKKGALDYVVKSDTAFLDMPRIADRALREWGHIKERERAEEELRAREEELAAIYENAPLLMLLVDSDRKVRKANAAAATFADRPAADMVGLSGGEALRCLKSLDDPNGCGFGLECQECRVRNAVMDTLESGRNLYQLEASLPFAVGGTRKDVHFLLSTTRVHVRQQPMALVSVLDITARKRAEEALKESEELFRAIFDNRHVVMIIVDPESGKICDASPGACKFYGYSREEIKTKTVFEMNVDPPEEVTERMRAAKSGPQKYFDFRHRLAGGEVREVEVCSGPIVVAGKTLLFSVVNDVTDRKNAERALKESEERFRAVFESAGESIFIKDHSLRYTHVNPAMCRLLELPASKIVGTRSEDIYDEETAKQLIEREARVLAGESMETEQTRGVRGVRLTFHDALVPLKNPDGAIIGLCCISRNITERKRLAGESQKTQEKYLSQAMRLVLSKARVGAETDSLVLLQGESGSGKDHLARWIHDHSRRSGGPYFSINCAALPKALAESELFGYERGAFTGAAGRKRGLLELAEGGTILLNEIGELDLTLQAKLLAFLDTRSFLRVGGQKHIRVNARLISATHRDLKDEVAEGRFLEPLYYRLSVFPIVVPPLRERLEDLPDLVDHIMSKIASELQVAEIPVIRQNHIECLSRYSWPGNVRELKNVLERSLILWHGGEFNVALPEGSETNQDWSYTVRYVPGKALREVTDEVEASLCAEVLKLCNDNKKETARLLDISRDTLYRHIRKIRRNS